MNQVNYQKELEKILNTLQEKGEAASDYRPPRLFLHSCCAPCSSYCLEYLCRYFLITVFYYNPNISFSEEYRKRVAEQKRLIAAYNKEEKGWPIDIVEGDYEPERFYEMAKGYENCPEGGERCFRCFDLRLRMCVLSAFLAGGGRQADVAARKTAKAAGILHSLWGICAAACGGFRGGTDAFTAVRASYRKN